MLRHCRGGRNSGRWKFGRCNPQGVSHHETAPELARRFTCFELDQKSATDACCERKLVLPHIQGAPSTSDERTKGERHLGCPPARDAFVVVHLVTRVPAREISA